MGPVGGQAASQAPLPAFFLLCLRPPKSPPHHAPLKALSLPTPGPPPSSASSSLTCPLQLTVEVSCQGPPWPLASPRERGHEGHDRPCPHSAVICQAGSVLPQPPSPPWRMKNCSEAARLPGGPSEACPAPAGPLKTVSCYFPEPWFLCL